MNPIPVWRRVTILALCLLGIVFALPNLFYDRVERHNDAVAAIEAAGFATPEQEADRALWPDWLPSGLVPLGLDLRGGAHLLAEVRVADVYKARIDALAASGSVPVTSRLVRRRNSSSLQSAEGCSCSLRSFVATCSSIFVFVAISGSGAGDASSVIKGGGTDLSRKEGQRQKTNEPDRKKITDPKAAKAEEARLEKERLEKLKAKLEEKIETHAFLKQFKKQLIIDITSEGLRIQIVDEKNRPMFASGSAVMQSYAREILLEIAKVLNEVPNTISLSGHTDAVPYSGGERGYSNWELSADRANASRRELVTGGIEEGKLLRVVGLSSAVPFDKEDHNNPINRRISIIVMNKETEDAIRSDGKKLDVPVEALKEAARVSAAPIKP